LFELDDEGYVVAQEIIVPPELEDRAIEGLNACPECALTIVEDSSGSA
jgi:ferredoxin